MRFRSLLVHGLFFDPFSDRMCHDLVSSWAEVHEIVDVGRLVHGIADRRMVEPTSRIAAAKKMLKMM